MILNCYQIVTLALTQKHLPVKTVRFSLKIQAKDLRAQLDQLHHEAQTTGAEASKARFRLMRLSEAAEKLRQQAAINVQRGRENDARELLVQKKKVMLALEKTTNRIALLDELSAKLNEAISVMESQLIERISSDLEVGQDAASGPVRIVSSKEGEDPGDLIEKSIDSETIMLCEDKHLQVNSRSQSEGPFVNADDSTGIENMRSKYDLLSSLKGISSYEDFLARVDQHLETIEDELVTVLSLSTLLFDEMEKTKSAKAKILLEVLEGVRGIRESEVRTLEVVHEKEIGKCHVEKQRDTIDLEFNFLMKDEAMTFLGIQRRGRSSESPEAGWNKLNIFYCPRIFFV